MKVYRDTALDGARSYRGWARWGVGDGQAIELWFLVAPLGDVTGRVKECHESAGAALPSHCPPFHLGQSWEQGRIWRVETVREMGEHRGACGGEIKASREWHSAQTVGLSIMGINPECLAFP